MSLNKARSPCGEQPVQWHHYTMWHDCPVQGWIRVAGHYHLFVINDQKPAPGCYQQYDVFHVAKRVKLAHLRAIRRFRHHVSWEQDSCHDIANPEWTKLRDHKPGWQEYLASTDPLPDFNYDRLRKIGTTDLVMFRPLS